MNYNKLNCYNDWTAVFACENHTLAAKSDNGLWAWGSNTSGQLGIGFQTTPVLVGTPSGSVAAPVDVAEYATPIDTDDHTWIWEAANGQTAVPEAGVESTMQTDANTDTWDREPKSHAPLHPSHYDRSHRPRPSNLDWLGL